MSLRYFNNIDDIDITPYYNGKVGYILWHPWFGGGINNYRQSLEIAYSFTFLTNRILVIPETYNFNFLNWGVNFGTGWGLNQNGTHKKEALEVNKFFQVKGINVIGIKEFCNKFGFTEWSREDKFQRIFYDEIPSDIKIINDFTNPYVIYDDESLLNQTFNRGRDVRHIDSIIPTDEKFVYLYQNTLGIYYHQFATSKINILKKLINKHFRITDEIFNYSESIINKINKEYHSIHIRKYIQYTETIKESSEIIDNLLKQIPKGSNLYISTDDKLNEDNASFYNHFRDNFNIMFYEDFDLSSPIFEPLVETLICARSQKFFAQFPSTYSSYICRLRGLMGDVNTNYYDNYREYDERDNGKFLEYTGLYSFFAKETPDGWLYE
jgi:hypothetical protein